MCVLMFSVSMPILPFFALVYYLLMFLFYKFTMTFYYSRTSSFSRDLPMA